MHALHMQTSLGIMRTHARPAQHAAGTSAGRGAHIVAGPPRRPATAAPPAALARLLGLAGDRPRLEAGLDGRHRPRGAALRAGGRRRAAGPAAASELSLRPGLDGALAAVPATLHCPWPLVDAAALRPLRHGPTQRAQSPAGRRPSALSAPLPRPPPRSPSALSPPAAPAAPPPRPHLLAAQEHDARVLVPVQQRVRALARVAEHIPGGGGGGARGAWRDAGGFRRRARSRAPGAAGRGAGRAAAEERRCRAGA